MQNHKSGPQYHHTNQSLAEVAAVTYTKGSILVQLVFGGDAKARAVAASGPGQVHGCLQRVAHLLVDGASKLSTIIALENKWG